LLRAAALSYLARFAATEAGLTQVLTRRVESWARLTDADPDTRDAAVQNALMCIPTIVAQLVAAGAVSDAAFAESRARALARAGRSRRAIGAHLANRGVKAELAANAAPSNPGHEFAAALIHARKRRLGPWRKAEASPEALRRELGSFARAGFAHDVASRVLRAGLDEAEAAITAFRAAL
jgi:regulatory protein